MTAHPDPNKLKTTAYAACTLAVGFHPDIIACPGLLRTWNGGGRQVNKPGLAGN